MYSYVHEFRILVQLVYSMAVAIGQLGNNLGFWMLSNNLDLEIGKTLVNISKRVLQRVTSMNIFFYECRTQANHVELIFLNKRQILTKTYIDTEAKEEYIARYLNGNIGKHTWPPTDSYVPNLTDQTKSDHGPLSPDLTSRLPPLDITPEEAAQLGYMPQRDDFERVKIGHYEDLISF